MSSAAVGLRSFLCRAQDKAVLDRYGLVRKFFTRQASTAPTSAHARIYLSRYSSVTYTQDLRSRSSDQKHTLRVALAAHSTQSIHHSWLLAYRSIHTTTRLAQNQPPSGSSRPPQESKNSRANTQSSSETPPSAQQDLRPLENYSKFFRQLALSLPNVHRPTRDDFLNAASGFWQRMRVRFKWLTIRSFRKYNADEISAFVTWFFMSQTLWLLVGT